MGDAEVRVLAADDQALVRESFSLLVDSAPGLRCVGVAEDGAEAIDRCRSLRPDVVLMDVRMPELDGIEATRIVCSDPELSGTRVLMLTTFDLDAYVFDALRAGASGFLLKDTPPQELIRAIRLVHGGEALLSPGVTKSLIREFAAIAAPAQRPTNSTAGLTPREVEVLQLIARGLSNSEIAAGIYVSPATVKTHVGRLLSKLNARDRAQLVIVAYESGLAGRDAMPPKGR